MAKKTLYIAIEKQDNGFKAEVILSKSRRPTKREPYSGSKYIVNRTLIDGELHDLFEAIEYTLEGHI